MIAATVIFFNCFQFSPSIYFFLKLTPFEIYHDDLFSCLYILLFFA